jgi:hypothetical protein
VQGAIDFTARGKKGEREVTIRLPSGCAGELVMKKEEILKLLPGTGAAPAGHCLYRLPTGETTTVRLKYS